MNKTLKIIVGSILLFLLGAAPIFGQYTNLNPGEVKEVRLTKIEALSEAGERSNIEFEQGGLIDNFVNDYFKNLGDVVKEIDGPVQMSFKVNKETLRGERGSIFTEESRNQPSGFVVTCRIITGQLSPEMIQFLLNQKFSTQYLFTYGPTDIKEKSATDASKDLGIERAMEYAFGGTDGDIDPNDQRVYRDKAVQPSFPGEEPHLNKFIYENIIAPLKARDPNLTKTLSYQFYVEKDGSLSNFLAIANRGSEPSLFGLDVIQTKMPKWFPAIRNGKYVRAMYILQVKIKSVYTEEMIQQIMNPE